MAKGKFITPQMDININKGDDTFFQVNITAEDGRPVDITGCLFKCKVKESATSNDTIFEGKTKIVDAAKGIIEVHFLNQDGSKINIDGENFSELTQYTYDIIMKDTNGYITRLANGYVFISPSVTWEEGI
jgi:hypothetical protein|nr:MAG TPA: hypothetical protein [Bacteriophage sp.]DAS35094.1 MAG TPA: hypothetical protein [Caudoviricetes sp.]